MKGIILKDLYQLKDKLYSPIKIAILISILLLSGFYFGESSAIITIFLSFLMVNSIQSVFVYDEESRWMPFVKSIPISNRVLVVSRYTVLVIISLIASAIGLMYTLIVLVGTQGYYINDVLLIVSLTFMGSVFYGSIILPFMYGFGQNGLSIAVVFMFSSVFLLIKFTNFTEWVSKQVTNNTTTLLGMLLGLLITVCISIIVSNFISHLK